MKINTLKLIFILLLLTGCSEDDNVFGPEEVVDESYQIYDFYLSSDELNYTNGYYEFNMSVSGQALTKLSANTNKSMKTLIVSRSSSKNKKNHFDIDCIACNKIIVIDSLEKNYKSFSNPVSESLVN